jgi:hypothetical protein
VRGGLSEAWAAYRDRLVRRCTFCGSWAYDQDDCTACGSHAAAHPRPVREHHPEMSRDYLDLLAIADAEIRAHDETEVRSA